MKKIINFLKKRRDKKSKKKESESKSRRIIMSIIWTVAYIALVIGMMWAAPKTLKHLLKTEYPMAAITSRSMWPVLDKGDLVFIQGVHAKEEIEVGDIIVYANDEGMFTIHRVVETKEKSVITKGDANNIKDSPVDYNNVIGKLYTIGKWNARIPKLGFVSTVAVQYR